MLKYSSESEYHRKSSPISIWETITENQKKLEARYGEQFAVKKSEVREKGDL